MERIKIWRGDITKLKVDAIVNAANESGLGCRVPGCCIDSAIHLAAGPGLLEECKQLGGIPTAVAKITNAHNLPSRYIIHVTGPRAAVHGIDLLLLQKCYIEVLKLAEQYSIGQIAFCCLSTGVFGFPKRESAQVAISTCQWASKVGLFSGDIIFNVFDDENARIYSELLKLKDFERFGDRRQN